MIELVFLLAEYFRKKVKIKNEYKKKPTPDITRTKTFVK